MTDTRPLCSRCGGRGLERTWRLWVRPPCGHCFGSGREPRIVDSGPINIRTQVKLHEKK